MAADDVLGDGDVVHAGAEIGLGPADLGLVGEDFEDAPGAHDTALFEVVAHLVEAEVVACGIGADADAEALGAFEEFGVGEGVEVALDVEGGRGGGEDGWG